MKECGCDVKKCKAWCCKGFFVHLDVPVSEWEYMRLHGYRVRNGQVSIWIKARCSALTDENKCSLYGRPERPAICNDFDCQGGCFEKVIAFQTREKEQVKL